MRIFLFLLCIVGLVCVSRAANIYTTENGYFADVTSSGTGADGKPGFARAQIRVQVTEVNATTNRFTATVAIAAWGSSCSASGRDAATSWQLQGSSSPTVPMNKAGIYQFDRAKTVGSGNPVCQLFYVNASTNGENRQIELWVPQIVGGSGNPPAPRNYTPKVTNSTGSTKTYGVYADMGDGNLKFISGSNFTVGPFSSGGPTITSTDCPYPLVIGSSSAGGGPGYYSDFVTGQTPIGGVPTAPTVTPGVKDPLPSPPSVDVKPNPETPVNLADAGLGSATAQQVTYAMGEAERDLLRQIASNTNEGQKAGKATTEELKSILERIETSPEDATQPTEMNTDKPPGEFAVKVDDVKAVPALLPVAPSIDAPGKVATFALDVPMIGVNGTMAFGFDLSRWATQIGVFRAFVAMAIFVGFFFLVAKTIRGAFHG